MFRSEKTVTALAARVNWIAAGAIVCMMLLTVADVVLRMFRHPIPGTYEIVGLLGTVAISFSLAYTSVEKGHIAVEFLVQRLSQKTQALISTCNALVAMLLFIVVTVQCVSYGLSLMQKGEVSLTVQIPIYPFAFGVAAGCGLLCPVLLAEALKAFRSYRSYARDNL